MVLTRTDKSDRLIACLLRCQSPDLATFRISSVSRFMSVSDGRTDIGFKPSLFRLSPSRKPGTDAGMPAMTSRERVSA